MNRVADKNGMIARRATQVGDVVILRCQGAQQSERPFLSQPARALALRAVCGERLRHVTAQQPIAEQACNPLPHRRLRASCRGCCSWRRARSRHVTGEASRLREQPLATIPALTASRTVSWSLPFASSPFLHPIPQSRMRGHAGLNQRFPKFAACYAVSIQSPFLFAVDFPCVYFLRRRGLARSANGLKSSRTDGEWQRKPCCY